MAGKIDPACIVDAIDRALRDDKRRRSSIARYAK
jgi:hypothetical protein